MTKEITTHQAMPRDPKTGLTLLLSKLLGSQELGKHRAMVAVELEVMAKKMDRFGWERDRGTAAHDRLMSDWMDALQDYPLDEVQAACREWVVASPRKMPNEGDILGIIKARRFSAMQAHKATLPAQPEPPRKKPTPEEAREIMQRAGIAVKHMGGSA